MDMTPPVYKRDRTRSETHAEQGKPVTLPETAGEPQGTLLTEMYCQQQTLFS